MAKVTIVGAGGVGIQTASFIAMRNLADLVLIDIIEGWPQGKALDLQQAMAIASSGVKIVGSNDYAPSAGSDIVIITAGLPRKPGMSREDLININSKIMQAVISNVVKYSPQAILIVVTNPLDAMVNLAYELSGLPKERVIGMAGVLDSARFKTFIAQELNVNVKDVEAMVLGGHGDLMVPIIGKCTVQGEPLSKLLPAEKIDALIYRVRNAGAEIIGLLKKESTIMAPALSITSMVEAIILDKKETMPCSVLLEGEYDIQGLFIGVPIKLGRKGVEEIIELELSDQEKKEFAASAAKTKELVSKLKIQNI